MSDRGERYTDKRISQIDKRLQQTYRTAQRELEHKLKDFKQKFAAKDKQKRKDMHDGKISKQEYKDWLAGQVFMRSQFEDKIKQIEQVMLHHDKYAAQIINESRLDVFAENYYAEAFRANWIIQGIDWNIYNTQALERLIEDDPQLLPEWKIDEEKDYKWNYNKVNNIVKQGIIQGESIDQITDRLCKDLCTQDENRMRLFARTAMTGAQNAGRQVQMQQAADMGIEVNKRWIAVLDSRTRDTHRSLDGEEVPYDEDFSNGLEYPGDPSGDPAEVYNCRCTMQSVYPKYEDRTKKWRENVTVDDEPYEVWKQGKSASVEMTHLDIEQFRKKGETHQKEGEGGRKIVPQSMYNRLTKKAIKQGAVIVRGGADVRKHLDERGATASTIGNLILFRDDVTKTETLEEIYHFRQNLFGVNADKDILEQYLLNEIDAQKYLISVADTYKIPYNEREETKQSLKRYERELEEWRAKNGRR